MVAARIAGAGDGPSPSDWFNSLPPISRSFGAACVGSTLMFMVGILNPSNIYLSWELVGNKFHIWRLLTNFVFLGKFSFNFFIYMMMIARYSCVLERTTFQNRTDDFVFMNLFGMMTMLICTLLVPFLYSPFLTASLIFMHCYIWSRFNHTTQVSIMGMVQVQAFYLPWCLVALNVAMGGSPFQDLLGIFAGHLYYFCVELYPRAHGVNIIQTPQFIKKAISESGLGAIATPSQPASRNDRQPQGAPANVPRAFQGRGRRLAD